MYVITKLNEQLNKFNESRSDSPHFCQHICWLISKTRYMRNGPFNTMIENSNILSKKIIKSLYI